jgi:hypothetical protein
MATPGGINEEIKALQDDVRALKEVLGGIAGAGDRPVRLATPKLASVEAGSLESYYMVATFCFDLQRKLEYVCKAALEYEPQMDSLLARQIIADNAAIADEPTWKQRAEMAEKIMLRLYKEIGDEHDRGLRSAAKG